MKKIEFPRINKRVFIASAFFAIGLISLKLLNDAGEKIFLLRKSSFEKKLGIVFNKKIDLGEYSGLRINGVSLSNATVKDIDNPESRIEVKNIYIGVKPLNSLFFRKWIFSVKSKEINIDVEEKFFKKYQRLDKKNKKTKLKRNYDIHIDLQNLSSFKISDSNFDGNLKLNLLYRSNPRSFIGVLNSRIKGKGNFKLKFNAKDNFEDFGVALFSKGINIDGFNFKFGNKKVKVNDGKLKSNFKFYKSPKHTYCAGNFLLNDIEINSSNLNKNISSKTLNAICNKEVLDINAKNLNYGTLTSVLKLNADLKNSLGNIKFQGELGYLDSLDPEINLSGNIPFWFDKRGFNLGNIDSIFNLNRTQLSNLNFFRKYGIRGFMTAEGSLKGDLLNPQTSVNFNIDYPHFRGIRIREIWDGNLVNQDDGFLLKMNNRYSTIPSFLSLKLDSKLNLENIEVSRIFDTYKGNLNILKKGDFYEWEANNFSLNEMELSLSDNNFDRIEGILNGSGIISKDQSYLDGRFALSLGKYKNINFANSLFDFVQNDEVLNINSSLYPIDGGVIDLAYKSNSDDLVNIGFSNISANWTVLTAIDILDFEKNEKIEYGTYKDLENIQIINVKKTLDEQFNFFNKLSRDNSQSSKQIRLKRYLNKFEGRYNGYLDVTGNNKSNYKIKTELNGYLKDKNIALNKKNNFSIFLDGGLFEDKGSLKIKRLPLSAANLFFDKSRDFKGSLDLNLNYDLDKKSFSSYLSSFDTSINDYKIKLQKGEIGFDKSKFNIALSFSSNKDGNPITFSGIIPIDKENELDLRLNGDQEFLRLIENLSSQNFSFKKGEANLRLLISGKIDQPIANGFLYLENGEIDFFDNSLKDIEASFIFDFDLVEVKNFNANGRESGSIAIEGSLPFYEKLYSETQFLKFSSSNFRLKGNNLDLIVDSDMEINGSFQNPNIKGNLAFNSGFINLKNNKQKIKKNNTRLSSESQNITKLWPELSWEKNENIEIISNESILNASLFNESYPGLLNSINFDDLKLKIGKDFRLQYDNLINIYLETRTDLVLNKDKDNSLNAYGFVDFKKGRANLYTTPFKLDKKKENIALFVPRSGIIPIVNINFTSKVPDAIIPISENDKDLNISRGLSANQNSNGFGSFGIGNTRFIKIEASYYGFLDQLSFEDKNKKIQLRSTPGYSRSQIIGLIGGNSANLINRAFISQLNGSNAFSERFQLSLYPALIENNEPINNIFSSEKLELSEDDGGNSSDSLSSQAWVAEIGLDLTDSFNIAFQTIPNRDDISPLGILTFQANQYIELLGSLDSDGEWKSQVQLFFRY